jgi:DNA polymerase III delta subunit
MPATLSTSRLHVIAGHSLVLRDELLAELLTQWRGPVKRTVEPGDPERIVLDLDTPSLFEEPALWLVRADGKYVRKHAETLARAVGPGGAGALVLTVSSLDRSNKSGDPVAQLQKALRAAGAWHEAGAPEGKELSAWLCARLTGHPQGVDRPRQVADALIEHLGDDLDALFATIGSLAIYAGDGPITTEAVEALVMGNAAKPIWEFTNAVLEGDARKAIELMHAGEGLEPQRALSSLVGELRKLIACCETADDAQAAIWIGTKGRPNLYYARQRARNLGKACLQRLLYGCLLVQRQLRQGGADLELAVEILVLHAQKVIRPAGR